MASTRLKETKDGRRFYEIRVNMGRDRPQLSTRWYVPAGWSKRAIDRELAKQAAEFELKCKAGEVQTIEEKRQAAAHAATEAAKILTLKQYGERVYMPSLTVRCSENTRSSFQSNLDKRIYPSLGEIKMPEITPAQISALLLSIQAEGKAHSTVVKVYAILHSLFKMAYMGDMIERNPMDKVERPKPRKDEVKGREVEAYTADELRHIIECLDKEPLKWRVYIHLLIDTGLRRGECCALRWENIDFQDHRLTVAGNLCYTPKKGVYLDTPKNGKTRTIDIDPEITALLRQLRAEQAEKAISCFVFTQEGSPEPMHPQSPTRYLKKFSERYNILDMHPHKLRHSFASVAITNGADVASVSEKLGHSDKAVTLRMYTHADQESIKRAGNIFREAIKAKAEKKA
ncbi:tyrosine-type recombinase/integrase [Evtepia sp.]|uniref:tyrosine-type recombinase/integrase n=1 Tax=Evtepia sp. TaxID=2773933 RepID=UPI002A801CB0|nr:tyrosine-type recombinase/integrase [Evtepia sp.]MDY4431061.1 tyrosine-type recombinase/integrase [Evtepia sp.]